MDEAPLIAPSAGAGRWRAAAFIIGVEITERFAYYGVSSNLISYLTGPLGESTASAAAAVNAWNGAASLLPFVGAAAADAWLGRYRTIVVASFIYILALSMLTLSAVLPYTAGGCAGGDDGDSNRSSCSAPAYQAPLFFFSLYLMALAQGGHKPNVQAFGADQFDEDTPAARAERSSFFNWWYLGMNGGNIVTVAVLNYVQDNVGWGWGFGIPCFAMSCALAVFLLGTKNYRSHRHPIAGGARLPINGGSREVMKLLPIWATCLAYAVIFAQWLTFFVKQSSTLDRRIGAFIIPAASLGSLADVAIVVTVLLYANMLVPAAGKVTRNPSGITMLQRIGVGIFISFLTMVVAAAVEMKRLATARDAGLVDQPAGVPLPMSVWWIVPQYILMGGSCVFACVGLQEFFYTEVPGALRSVGLALYLGIFGAGSFISSFLVSAIDKLTTSGGGVSWFDNNLNRGHLDYFYWMLAVVAGVGLLLFVHFARSHEYRKNEDDAAMIRP